MKQVFGAGMWRAWIPAVVLMAIALTQITLARTAAFCPWKGGGFGMFSTNDATFARDVRVFIERPVPARVEIARALEVMATQAKLFPSDSMLRRLALAVVSRERNEGRPVNDVRIEIWRTEFAPGSLEAQDRLVKTFTYHVPQSAD